MGYSGMSYLTISAFKVHSLLELSQLNPPSILDDIDWCRGRSANFRNRGHLRIKLTLGGLAKHMFRNVSF